MELFKQGKYFVAFSCSCVCFGICPRPKCSLSVFRLSLASAQGSVFTKGFSGDQEFGAVICGTGAVPHTYMYILTF